MKKILFIGLAIVSLLLVWSVVRADDTGAISPGTMADDATVGTVAWTNPDNAKVSDNVYATESIGATTHYSQSHKLWILNSSWRNY